MKHSPAHHRTLQHSGRLAPLKLACFLAVIACSSTEPIEKNLLFEGTITDVAGGAPIAGTTVFVGVGTGLFPTSVQSTTSDAQGHYTLSHQGCIHNPYVVVIAAGYYVDSEKVGCKPDSQTLNFSLTRDPLAQ